MIKNQIKTALLLGVLTGLVLVIGQLFGGTNGLVIAFILAILMNVFSYFFSHKLILFMYRAKPASKSDYPELHKMIEEISKEANIPKPQIYIVPDKNPNAFACGPNYKHSVVAATQGILDLLTKEELKGVIAHEISHIKNRDILISTIAATIASVISYLAYMARFAPINSDREEGNNIIGLLILFIVAPIAAMLIQLAISRSREYIADETGARLIKNSLPLAAALQKLESHGKQNPMRLGTDSTNQMFIVNPFRGTGRFLVNLFSTHPAVSERVQRLKSLKI